MRFYMKLLERCFQELGGFFIFLFFITIAFATSSNIIDRNQYRDREIDLEKGDKTYDIDIYQRHGLLKDKTEHLKDFAQSLYRSSMILFGEFDIDDAGVYQKIWALFQAVILITITMNSLVGLMNEVFGDL